MFSWNNFDEENYIKKSDYSIDDRMKKVLLVLAIVGMFLMPMMPAKNSASNEKEINYLQLAKNLLQNWDEKLATEGANSEEINETVQKMELYEQILKNEVKNMEKMGNVNLQEIVDRVTMIMELDSRIEWNKYLWEQHIKAIKEYEEYKEGKIKLKFFNAEIPNTLSTVYPTGGWKKRSEQVALARYMKQITM